MFAQGNEAPSLLMLSMSAEPDVWRGVSTTCIIFLVSSFLVLHDCVAVVVGCRENTSVC